MKPTAIFIYLLSFFALLQSCSTTRRFGTTIERDENNPCQINMIIQVAVQGTPDDVTAVRSALESCYNQECFIPCPNDSMKGCKTKITVDVKAYGDIKSEEAQYYHYVLMVDEDGKPSNAQIGRPNSDPVSGEWRRGSSAGTYCHEVLHFCGLRDKYCARIYDPVTDSIKTERNCEPPPDPNGNCCSPSSSFTRCTYPCPGHDDDIMGSSWAGLSCENILDVLKGANYGDCPDVCCGSNQTFTRPPTEYYMVPGYLNFGEKNNKLGAYGVSIGGTKYLGSSLGITIEAGAHTKSETNDEVKQSSNFIHLNGGINYKLPLNSSKLSIKPHAMIGGMIYNQKTKIGDLSSSNSETSLLLNIGLVADLNLNRNWALRLLEVNYMPTFFFNETQNNIRIGAGIVYKPGR